MREVNTVEKIRDAAFTSVTKELVQFISGQNPSKKACAN
jgi:hypothetical protein